MHSLETWLGQRQEAGVWRNHLSRRAACLPPLLRKLAKRMIWPGGLSHMRYLPADIALVVGPEKQWTVSKNGRVLAESRQLVELVPSIGETVGIVATGPSALEYPWEKARDEGQFLIAVNGAPTLLAPLGVQPDLLVVTDREFAQTGAHHLDRAPGVPLAIEFLAAAALAASSPHVLMERPFAILERINLWYGLRVLDSASLQRLNLASGSPLVLPALRDPKCRVGWSRRPEIGVFSGRTVVFGALQIAVGLGARRIKIIGMDLGGGRAYAEESTVRPTQLNEHYETYILPAFQTMAEALQGTGVSVENLSGVCPLPADLFHVRSI